MLMTDRASLARFEETRRLWQGIPGIEVTRKGRVFLTFYSGGTGEQIGNFCVLLRSDDGAQTCELTAAAFEEDHRCYDPCLWIDPAGRLWFFWARMPEHGVFAAVCEDPDAETLSWSAPVRIGGDVMMNKPIIARDGRWLLPVAVWGEGVRVLTPEFDTKDPDRKPFVYESADEGYSFTRLGGADMPERSFDEHMLLETSEGLAMYSRTHFGIARALSKDGGVTWTKGEDSGLGGPDSRFHIRRLSSGRILLINHVEYTGRNNLTALLSEDEGKTWPYALLLLDGRDNVSYPDAKQTPDGAIWITYDRERGASRMNLADALSCAREILVSRVAEEDILAGRLINPDSFLRRVASKLTSYEGEDPFAE